ncbi:unnamed protein product [marine sediment metagenome]|uniref:Uncharacterized protein n=1 Tax=marine sediment metagenome TaxID=412755 RepID=X1IW84_9ZZZZ
MKKFEGTFVVSVTPMTKDEELDIQAFQARALVCEGLSRGWDG